MLHAIKDSALWAPTPLDPHRNATDLERMPRATSSRLLVFLNVLLGPSVLLSYVLGFAAYDGDPNDLWGTVPESVRGLYTANMFLAAAGYLTFTSYLLWRVSPEHRWFDRLPAGFVNVLYLLVLVGSIAWLPLCVVALEGGRGWMLPLIVIDLWAVALGSLGLLALLVATPNPSAPRHRVASIVGACFFCLQTVVLDASIWPWFFSVGG